MTGRLLIVARHRLIPVVVSSAHGTVGRAVSGMRAGAFDVVTKPDRFDVLALMRRVDALLEQLEHSLTRMARVVLVEKPLRRQPVLDAACRTARPAHAPSRSQS